MNRFGAAKLFCCSWIQEVIQVEVKEVEAGFVWKWFLYSSKIGVRGMFRSHNPFRCLVVLVVKWWWPFSFSSSSSYDGFSVMVVIVVVVLEVLTSIGRACCVAI